MNTGYKGTFIRYSNFIIKFHIILHINKEEILCSIVINYSTLRYKVGKCNITKWRKIFRDSV
jgi:hypothetical protein